MRKILYIAAALVAIALTACNKDWGPDAHDNDLCGISLRFQQAAPTAFQTKADAIGPVTEDDLIDRLDVFVYRGTDTTLFDHKSYVNASGVDIAAIDTKYYDVQGTYFYFFAIANLDGATADYFAQLSKNQITSYYGGLIPLEAGNFRSHRPIMGGAASVQLGNYSYYSSQPGDKTASITLYRYVARFEIEKITADFDSADLMNSDVIVKGIVWTNVANALRPLQYFPSPNTVESGGPVFGSRSTYFPEQEFGNMEYPDGYRYYQANENHHGWVSLQENYNLVQYGATGALAADFPYIYNNNWKLEKDVLNVDAPGYMRDATTHFFTGETGRVCSSTNPSQSHVLNVNKEFYIFPISRNSYATSMCSNFDGQDDSIKMVIVVEINGKTYYYPYRALYVQPNSRYLVHNITLKGIGSEYSNFYVKKFSATLGPMSVGQWQELEVDNIDMGYKDYDGNEIY